MTDFVAALRQNIEAVLIRHFPESPMRTGEMTLNARWDPRKVENFGSTI
jgi:hypothetical protein